MQLSLTKQSPNTDTKQVKLHTPPNLIDHAILILHTLNYTARFGPINLFLQLYLCRQHYFIYSIKKPP